MLSIQPDNPDSQDLDIERPGDVPVFKKKLETLSGIQFKQSVNEELETYKQSLLNKATFGCHSFIFTVESFEEFLKDYIIKEKLDSDYSDDYVDRDVNGLFDHNLVRKLIKEYVHDTWKMGVEELDSGKRIKISW